MDETHPSQLAQYIPVLFLLAAAIGFAGGTLLVSVLLGKYGKRTRAKDTPYECGKDPIGEGSPRFSVKFYLVAMLFIRSTSRWSSFIRGRSCIATCWLITPRATWFLARWFRFW